MIEKMPFETPSQPAARRDTVHFTRHGQAEYKTYRKIRASKNPRSAMDYEAQIIPDLSAEGVALAERQAEELLSKFDPAQDVLFFASSNEARALETADIYRRLARQKGFEVLKPLKPGLKLAEKIGEGEIKVVRNLSLNEKDVLLQALFNPDHQNKAVNWEALDSETRRKCDAVRAMVREHDHGSFGANFFHYSTRAQEIFPEIRSAKDLYDRQFHNLLRLVEFGIRKARESGQEKNVKILAFGHENYMAYALDKYFQGHDIKNCETIDVDSGESGIELTRRGNVRSVS